MSFEKEHNIPQEKNLVDSLEKRGLIDLTKAYLRTSLYETLKQNTAGGYIANGTSLNFTKLSSNKTIENLVRMEFTLILDFMKKMKMTYSQNVFSNEIKGILENNIPFNDTDVAHCLKLNLDDVVNSRLRTPSSNRNLEEQVKSPFLYILLTQVTNLMKTDTEIQTE